MGSLGEMRKRSGDEEMTKAFCDDVYGELEGIRLKILTMKEELEFTYGKDSEPFRHYERHLTELADQIEWKLQILSHACPYDWKGSMEKVESVVSVQPPDVSASSDLADGYIGG